MKINIKNFIGILAFATLLSSCDTTNESNYTPEAYDAPASLTLTENATATTDNSFEVVYASSSLGKGYYAVVVSGTTAPTSSQVHSGTGFIKSGNFNVDVTTPTTINVDSDVYGAYSYDVYGIHKSSDNFISETVTKLTVVTPDTAAPVFNGDTSSPSFQSAGISPFAPVTFNFSEPVFYQGGDITFTGFSSGRIITVNTADALTINGPNVTVNTHGTFEQDDFIIVTWAEGTFKDNSGKSVADLSGFAHYFKTRLFTAPEAAALMVGTYNYAAVFYGGSLENFYTPNASLFLPTTGEFELKLDPSDASGSTLLGVNVFSPLNDYGYTAPANLKIKFGEGGELAILDELQTSGIPFSVSTTWRHYSSGFTTAQPGYYDVTAGTINHYLSITITDTAEAFDDIDYNYTRIGTFAKPSFEELEKKNEYLQKKRAQHKTYKKIKYNTIKIGQ